MRVSAKAVLAEVAESHGLTPFQMVGTTSRVRKFAWARQDAMLAIYMRCPHMSLPQIGAMMGGKDHTTVLHGIKAAAGRAGMTYEQVKEAREKAKRPTQANGWHLVSEPATFRQAMALYGNAMGGKAA